MFEFIPIFAARRGEEYTALEEQNPQARQSVWDAETGIARASILRQDLPTVMKALSSLACLFLALSPAVHSAPSEAEKPKPLAPAKSVFRFLSYDKDPKSAKTYVQVEHNGRSYFLEIGDIIPKTSFKIAKLEGEKLTLIDTVANETLVLPRGKVVDSAVVEAK